MRFFFFATIERENLSRTIFAETKREKEMCIVSLLVGFC